MRDKLRLREKMAWHVLLLITKEWQKVENFFLLMKEKNLHFIMVVSVVFVVSEQSLS